MTLSLLIHCRGALRFTSFHRGASRLAIVALALSGCPQTPPQAAAPTAAAALAASPRYGALMAEVGRRFELAGKAAVATRYELCAFEVDEIGELFEGDLPHAEVPKEGDTAALPALAASFTKVQLPELLRAAQAKDGPAFAAAFARASVACNACHQTSGHGFVQIPATPGSSVPDLDRPAP